MQQARLTSCYEMQRAVARKREKSQIRRQIWSVTEKLGQWKIYVVFDFYYISCAIYIEGI